MVNNYSVKEWTQRILKLKWRVFSSPEPKSNWYSISDGRANVLQQLPDDDDDDHHHHYNANHDDDSISFSVTSSCTIFFITGNHGGRKSKSPCLFPPNFDPDEFSLWKTPRHSHLISGIAGISFSFQLREPLSQFLKHSLILLQSFVFILNIYIYIYIFVCMYVCVCMYYNSIRLSLSHLVG